MRAAHVFAMIALPSTVALALLGAPGCGGDDKKTSPPLQSLGGSGGSSTGKGGKAGAAGKSGAAGAAGVAGAAGATGGAAGCAPAAGAAGAAGSVTPCAGAAGASGLGGAGGAPGDCNDKKKDGDETDVDCGGACVAMGKTCGMGAGCKIDKDCVSAFCNPSTNVCGEPTCVDKSQNAEETDVDCGGPSCGPCGDLLKCKKASDCTSGICDGTMHCAVPSCTDKVRNGDETDIDCGGTCPKCDSGGKCKVAGDCKTAVCGNDMSCKCPPGMASIPRTDGGSYCIDQTEVDYEDYQKFWTANPVANDAGECAWNKTYTPTGNWPPLPGDKFFPVRFVDWCDAKAYCAWSGKHLCGQVGSTDPVADADFANAAKSEWFNACSAMGNNVYPYGAAYKPKLCAGENQTPTQDFSDPTPKMVMCKALGPGETAICPVKDTSGLLLYCIGGSPELYGMSGNVAEWENSCSGVAGATDDCRIRGGGAASTQDELKCAGSVKAPRNTTSPYLGIRCCL